MPELASRAHDRGLRTTRRLTLVLVLFSVACATPSGSPLAVRRSPSISRDLALLTFDSAWSRIAHTHYDTAFGGVDWHAGKAELRPRAAAATSLDELRSVISAMLARLGESHYGLIPREAAAVVQDTTSAGTESTIGGDVGAELRLVGDDLLVWRVDPDGPAAVAGVRMGGRVVAIDGAPVEPRLAVVRQLPRLEQRTARTRLLYQLNALLKGGPGTAVTLRLESGDGVTSDYRMVRREQPGEVVQFGNLPPFIAELRHERIGVAGGCVGVIRLNVWVAPLGPSFDRAVDAVRDCKGIVIDLRGNPGGVAGMVMGTAGHFLRDTLPLGFMRSRSGPVLRFKANPRRVRADGMPVEPYAGPLAILTDEMSASTSEFFAAGLQGVGRARVFGGNSAGQALPAMLIRLPTDDVLMHVMADFTGPRGVRIEGRGVQPDVPVPDTRQDLLAQRDAPLRAALAWITGAGGAGALPTGGLF
jgi:carboxyl-terminal processing protease